MAVKTLTDLEVYNRAEILAEEVWQEVTGWKDFFAKDTVGKQLVRTMDSIGSNIAEGYGRYHYKENKNFCFYSRGSLMEARGWIFKIQKQKSNRRNKGGAFSKRTRTDT